MIDYITRKASELKGEKKLSKLKQVAKIIDSKDKKLKTISTKHSTESAFLELKVTCGNDVFEVTGLDNERFRVGKHIHNVEMDFFEISKLKERDWSSSIQIRHWGIRESYDDDIEGFLKDWKNKSFEKGYKDLKKQVRRLNKTQILVKQRMKILEHAAYHYMLDNRYDVSAAQLATDFHGKMIENHENYSTIEKQYEWYIKSLIESKDLSRSDHAQTIVNAQALKTLDEYNRLQNNHRDGVELANKQRHVTFWLVVFSAINAVIAATNMYWVITSATASVTTG